jgi:hypothetical protein
MVVVEALASGSWGAGWLGWVAAIWGAFLALQFMTTFVSPSLWGRDTEERMVQREIDKRRGTRPYTPPQEEPIDIDEEP